MLVDEEVITGEPDGFVPLPPDSEDVSDAAMATSSDTDATMATSSDTDATITTNSDSHITMATTNTADLTNNNKTFISMMENFVQNCHQMKTEEVFKLHQQLSHLSNEVVSVLRSRCSSPDTQ